MNAPIQNELFDTSMETRIAQEFEAWKKSAGGAEVMRIAYAIAASYARRFQMRGRRVSMKLIWEQLRDNVVYIRARKKALKVGLEKLDGFALNNNFHAYVARHILAHKPTWAGLFELREVGKVRTKRKVIVIEEPIKLNQPCERKVA